MSRWFWTLLVILFSAVPGCEKKTEIPDHPVPRPKGIKLQDFSDRAGDPPPPPPGRKHD